MRHGAPCLSRCCSPHCSIDGAMTMHSEYLAARHRRQCCGSCLYARPLTAADVWSAPTPSCAMQNCLSLANLNPTAALGVADGMEQGERRCAGRPLPGHGAGGTQTLSRSRDAAGCVGPRARHGHLCALRCSIRPAMPGCWRAMAARAVASFSAALALSANDADLYADLARAQAMRKAWSEVESDLNAALRDPAAARRFPGPARQRAGGAGQTQAGARRCRCGVEAQAQFRRGAGAARDARARRWRCRRARAATFRRR